MEYLLCSLFDSIIQNLIRIRKKARTGGFFPDHQSIFDFR
jgi:hypothetical protein